MVIAKNFIFLHFPKCAGSEIEGVLRELDIPGAEFYIFGPPYRVGHYSIADRENMDPDFSVGNRDILCSFRKLPYWLLSSIYFAYNKNNILPTKEMFYSGILYDPASEIVRADDFVEKYSPDVVHWIRAEHLIEDFISVFSKYTQFDKHKIRKLFKYRNKAPVSYMRNIDFYFTKEQLAALYDRNPKWAALEKKLYGKLVSISGGVTRG